MEVCRGLAQLQGQEGKVDAHSDWPIQTLPWASYLNKFLLPKNRGTASPHFTGIISLSKDSDAFLARFAGVC